MTTGTMLKGQSLLGWILQSKSIES